MTKTDTARQPARPQEDLTWLLACYDVWTATPDCASCADVSPPKGA